MKTLLIAFLLFFSTVGICQDLSYTIQGEDVPVSENPYSWMCDSLEWGVDPRTLDENGDPYDCITDAKYYSYDLHVPAGTELTNITLILDVDSAFGENISPQNDGRGTFNAQFWQEPADDLKTMPGLVLLDGNNSIVLYLNRHVFSTSVVNDTLELPGLDVEAGDYEIRIIHEEPDNLGMYAIGTINTYPFEVVLQWDNGFVFRNVTHLLNTSPNLPNELYTDGPEVILYEISYDLNYVTIPSGLDGETFYLCENETLTLAPNCAGEEVADEFGFVWERQEGASWLLVGENCELDITRTYEEDGDNIHTYRLVNSYTFAEPVTSVFDVEVLPAPSWNYTITSEIFDDVLNCDVFFQVGIDSLNYQDSDVEYFDWIENASFSSNLEVTGIGDQGLFADFCFNPFAAPSDTIASFFVTGAMENGCSVLDTTYVIYQGDSIVFKNFLVPPGSTNIQEQVKHQAKLYPNPTNSHITVEHDFVGAVRFEIHDLSGRLVRQIQATGRLTMDVSDLPQGVYIAVIGDGENRVVNRLVKW